VNISKRQFFLSLAGMLLVLVALNYAVAFATRNSVPRRVMALARASSTAEVMALGNSLMAAGFDPSAFDKGMSLPQNASSVNLSLGASTPVEQLLLLRYALQHGMRPKLLVYGFYDFQLSTPVVAATRDLVGNRAMLYYVEPQYARQFYYLSPHDRVEFELMRHFPMMVDRGAVWAKVELFRRRLSQEGMPEERSNRFGRAADFSLLESASESDFAQSCEEASGRGLISAVDEIIRQASQAGMKVVFVEMPMNPEHVHRFYETPAWEKYRAHVQSLLAADGVTYIDASHWIGSESLFGDHLHLNEAGAVQFSERLGEQLRVLGASPGL
jgi:hypothetical protein